MAHTDNALSIRYYGTVVRLGVGRGIHTIAPLARDLKNAGNRVVSILGANAEPDLVREEAIRLVSDEVIVSALDGSRGDPIHVGYPLFERLSRDDVDLVVAVGPMEKVEQLELVVKMQDCILVALSVER
jgi:ferredoxin--NADP+ reductase